MPENRPSVKITSKGIIADMRADPIGVFAIPVANAWVAYEAFVREPSLSRLSMQVAYIFNTTLLNSVLSKNEEKYSVSDIVSRYLQYTILGLNAAFDNISGGTTMLLPVVFDTLNTMSKVTESRHDTAIRHSLYTVGAISMFVLGYWAGSKLRETYYVPSTRDILTNMSK